MVLGFHEGDDGAQEETTKMIACRNRSFASCKREERWLEVSGASVRCRASTNTGCAEGSRGLRPYQEVQIDKANSIAK
jgi:hypothetical protein